MYVDQPPNEAIVHDSSLSRSISGGGNPTFDARLQSQRRTGRTALQSR